MRWVDALKIYNEGKAWCIPRKGTKEHAEVKAIMAGGAKKAEQVSEVKKIRPRFVKREAEGDDINMRLKRLKELKGKISEKKKGKVEAFLREMVEKRRAAKKAKEEKPKIKPKLTKSKKVEPSKDAFENFVVENMDTKERITKKVGDFDYTVYTDEIYAGKDKPALFISKNYMKPYTNKRGQTEDKTYAEPFTPEEKSILEKYGFKKFFSSKSMVIKELF